MAKFIRKTYDQKTKDRIVGIVRNGQMTVSEVSKAENVQPYQVYAWIGEKALSEQFDAAGNGGSEQTGETSSRLSALPDFLATDLTDPDLARAIGEWWIKSHLLSRSPRK